MKEKKLNAEDLIIVKFKILLRSSNEWVEHYILAESLENAARGIERFAEDTAEEVKTVLMNTDIDNVIYPVLAV